MTEPRRLRGHKGSATCCIASRDRPGLVVTSGEDGRICWFDMRCKDPQLVMEVGDEPVTSLCFQTWLDKSENRICAVARDDGVIDVINVESEELTTAMKKSKNSPKKPQKGSKDSTSSSSTSDEQTVDFTKQRLHLDYSLGGHTVAVSCVAFSMFGEMGKFIVSGGNDKSVKLWNWFNYLEQDQDQTSSSSEILHLNINLRKRLNWLCTTPADSESLVVCDTSKVVKVYYVS